MSYTRVKALCNYNATSTNELNIIKGETMNVLYSTSDKLKVSNSQGFAGFVPISCVKEAKPNFFNSLKDKFRKNEKSNHQSPHQEVSATTAPVSHEEGHRNSYSMSSKASLSAESSLSGNLTDGPSYSSSPSGIYYRQNHSPVMTMDPDVITPKPVSSEELRHSYNVSGNYFNCLWYWGRITRMDCEAMLLRHSTGPNQYVVRDRESQLNSFAITVLTSKGVKNFVVNALTNGNYRIGENEFDTFDKLLQHYTHSTPIFKDADDVIYLGEVFQHPAPFAKIL